MVVAVDCNSLDAHTHTYSMSEWHKLFSFLFFSWLVCILELLGDIPKGKGLQCSV